MHEIKLGELVENPNQQRDAIHIAVAPVVAAESLKPGDHIGFLGYDTIHVGKDSDNLLGIVDPFLKDELKAGQRFLLFLYQNTVTGMRHHWEHPAFVSTESEAWLKEFAHDLEMTYENLLAAASEYLNNGEIYCLPIDTPDRVFSDMPKFWYHYSVVTNQPAVAVPDDDNNFFRCAC
ncbi:MAG: hypothetical protein DWQ19_09180 [Crenarchaeota archaeon]|nr:MAG: hypothetical protein DWQ19_09180 [Thermoproteota archaeon]